MNEQCHCHGLRRVPFRGFMLTSNFHVPQNSATDSSWTVIIAAVNRQGPGIPQHKSKHELMITLIRHHSKGLALRAVELSLCQDL